jgi:dTDP-D-glucose 4,6-dehydratase
MSKLGWRSVEPFDKALSDTVEWYEQHPEWLSVEQLD